MNGTICINDIQLYAYHGCLKEETRIGGNYIVDVEIITDLSEAARTDDLSKTVDYCRVYEIVCHEMQKPSKLIEHVGHRIILALKNGIDGIERVKIELTKIAPPVNGNVGSVCVIMEG